MMTDALLDKRGSTVPVDILSGVLTEICVPLTGRRLGDLRSGKAQVDSADELMIEFELSIKLIFKPLRHHIPRVAEANGDALGLWKCILTVLEDLLEDESTPEAGGAASGNVLKTMNELTTEHLQNAIIFLVSEGLIMDAESDSPFTAVTWDHIGRMGCCKNYLEEWKKAAAPRPPVALK